MNVGSFRHDISIYKQNFDGETVDEYGRRQIPLVEVCTVKAAVSDVSGREFYEAMSHQLQNTVTFTIRWVNGVSPAHIIRWNGADYHIDQINHLRYKRDFIRIKAHAVGPEGGTPYAQV